MSRMRFLGALGFYLLLLSGCLVTRDQIRETTARPSESSNSTPQVTPAQVTKAAQAARVDELEESLRQAMGRVEVLENQLSQMQSAQQSEQTKAADGAEVQQKLQAYEEALRSLEAQVQTLQSELNKAQTQTPAKPPFPTKPDATSEKAEKSGNFANAEEAFNSKDWKKAIVGYQKYRDLNPKGKWYSEATYKIGVSFQELGMNAEAKAFYDEVIAKFPNGKMAEKAKYRLKSLK